MSPEDLDFELSVESELNAKIEAGDLIRSNTEDAGGL